MPEKSIIYAVENATEIGGKWVDYYVSDEMKFSQMEERCKKEKWGEDKKKLVNIGSELEEAVKPISKSKTDYLGGSYIVFKSCLYRIGGIEVYSVGRFEESKAIKTVKKLDLNNMESDWVVIEDMNWGRINPQLVILGDELYVVGGLEESYKESQEGAVLMEVLKSDGSGWEAIFDPLPPCKEEDIEYYSRGNYSKVVAGAFKEGIIVAIPIPSFIPSLTYDLYNLYTYDPKEKKWEFYKYISSSYMCINPSVVSGDLMLFLGGSSTTYYLCVMGLETGQLDTISLFQTSVVPKSDIPLLASHKFLVMIEPGKFCFFWDVYGPQSSSSSNKYNILKACVFTLKRKMDNTGKEKLRPRNCICKCNPRYDDDYDCGFIVKIESRWSSLIPDHHSRKLQAVILVDYIPQDMIFKLEA